MAFVIIGTWTFDMDRVVCFREDPSAELGPCVHVWLDGRHEPVTLYCGDREAFLREFVDAKSSPAKRRSKGA